MVTTQQISLTLEPGTYELPVELIECWNCGQTKAVFVHRSVKVSICKSCWNKPGPKQ